MDEFLANTTIVDADELEAARMEEFRVYPRSIWEDFRVCVATDNAEGILPLIQAVEDSFSADNNACHCILTNFLHEAVEARAASTVKLLLSAQKHARAWSFEFFWVTAFEQVCENADDAAALFMFDLFPSDDWADMPVAEKIEELRNWIYPQDAYLDFYSLLLHLHAKIPDAKKVLERPRLRGLFRRWALNEELLAPAYKPPTAEAAGGPAFQRAENAALVVLA